MTHDTKLVERLAANEIDPLAFSPEFEGTSRRAAALARAERFLAAIDASVDEHGNRIAWVAPAELTPPLAKRGAAMVLDTQMASGHPERGGMYNDFELPMATAWRSVRDAHLAERQGEGEGR